MIRGMGFLLGFQLAGEVVVRALQLPVSASICGMAALLAWLCWHGGIPDDLGRVAEAVLANMGILFVPIGAGAIVHADLFQSQWQAVTLALSVGACATMTATAMTAQALAPRASDGLLARAYRHPIMLMGLLIAGAGVAGAAIYRDRLAMPIPAADGLAAGVQPQKAAAISPTTAAKLDEPAPEKRGQPKATKATAGQPSCAPADLFCVALTKAAEPLTKVAEPTRPGPAKRAARSKGLCAPPDIFCLLSK